MVRKAYHNLLKSAPNRLSGLSTEFDNCAVLALRNGLAITCLSPRLQQACAAMARGRPVPSPGPVVESVAGDLGVAHTGAATVTAPAFDERPRSSPSKKAAFLAIADVPNPGMQREQAIAAAKAGLEEEKKQAIAAAKAELIAAAKAEENAKAAALAEAVVAAAAAKPEVVPALEPAVMPQTEATAEKMPNRVSRP